ncbi:MAG TPA: hypothetical protein VII94_03615 [Candidatus Saccharimonadales bacterium]
MTTFESYEGDPYRSPAKSAPSYEEECKKFTMPKIPVFGYVLLSSLTFIAFGFGCEYLSRDLPEGHFSVSSFGYGLGMAIIGIYFLILALAKAMK